MQSAVLPGAHVAGRRRAASDASEVVDAGACEERLVGGAKRRACYDARVLLALRRIMHGVAMYSKQLAANNRITAPQLVCLLHVVHHGPVTATALSRAVHLSPSTIVGILDRLEEKGLASRERGRTDRRLVNVRATAAGAELAHSAPSPLQQTLADGLSALPEREQAMIALSLERVVALMEVPEADEMPLLSADPVGATDA